MTKERFDPFDNSFKPETRAHHFARYQFATQYTGYDFLDVCSGQGYGANLLKANHPEAAVFGIELDEAMVTQAQEMYPTCIFEQADLTKIEDVNALVLAWDLVTFFEAIEHLPIPTGEAVLSKISQQLKPDGKLILSTPRDIREDDNHYHISEWSYERLQEVLTPLFSNVDILGQSWKTGEITRENIHDSDFYICVCTK